MKKIILILFLFLLPFSCYIIDKKMAKPHSNILLVGDYTVNNPYFNDANKDFVNNDYRLIDLINTIKYNEELVLNDKTESIHKLLKESDALILSVGMNDIAYKLNDNPKEIYSYLNNLLNNYELLLQMISKYDYQKVYILNYYNISYKYDDLFVYTNYKLSKITKNYGYTYLDIAKILNNNPLFYRKSNDFTLNNQGYYQIYKLIVENSKKS